MGIKLKPTEIQDLLQKLYNKASGGSESSIPECNLYGEKEPWQIWGEAILASACKEGGGAAATLKKRQINQREVYVFTKVKKKTLNSSRIDRKVGTGAWKGEDTGVTIYGNQITTNEGTTTKLVGIRKRFRYESKTVHQGRWIMYEYALQPSALSHAKFQNYVLCRIKKMEGSEKKRKPEEEEESLDQILKLNHSSELPENTKKKRLEREENCNNNGVPSTSRTRRNLDDDDDDDDDENTRLPNGHDDGGHIIIDLSDDSDEKVNNNIGTTTPVPVDHQKQVSNSPESTIPAVEVDDHTDWAKAFAVELTEGQSHLLQEQEIEMLPNTAYFLDNSINSQFLV